MIGQLLDFTESRSGGGIRIESRPTNLDDLCAQAVGEVELVHPQWQIRYTTTGDPVGRSDPERLLQAGNVAGDILFYPWGQVWKGSSPEWHFGGFDYRDTTANLDPTLFRQYANAQGRWLSPDPMAGNVLNPQSLNRYAYVTNNPLGLVDPSGMFLSANPGKGDDDGGDEGDGVDFHPVNSEAARSSSTHCGVTPSGYGPSTNSALPGGHGVCY